jgi:hypothetical protein
VTDTSDTELSNTLAAAVSGLLWLSESDYPFETFLWKVPESAKSQVEASNILLSILLANVPATQDALIQVVEPDFFFHNVIQASVWQDQAVVQRYQQLLALLKANLTDLKVYRVGEIEISIYVLGRTSHGNVAGVKTMAIET